MIKIGYTKLRILLEKSNEIATLKEKADILKDNGETRPKKAYDKETQFKT